ncbi:helix-turn-helix domain-containing protein [Nonomuraea polychroma]|uniref:helix-turn-helix domain-containing protein n=1 Tax=Nonomuraea polychroma TaxID=46176 RepID=UPI003D8EB1AF
MTDTQPLLRHPLTHVRHVRRWSLKDVADLVQRRSGLNMAARREKVWRWENGRAVPELEAQLALAAELGIDTQTVLDRPWPSWLTVLDAPPAIDAAWTPQVATDVMAECMNTGTEMDRRAFLTLSGETALAVAGAWAAVAAVPADKLAHATGGGTVDTEIVTWVEDRLVQLWHLDDLIGGEYCLNLTRADLQLVHRLLRRGRCRSDIEQRLHRAAGELLRFSGWAAFDADRHAAAERYWHAGLRNAAVGGDPMTGAYILSQMAMQRTYAGDGRTAINLLEAARDKIGTGASRTVHAMLDAWQVRAHAVAGEPQQALRILARADDHWEHRDAEEDPPWIYWMARPSTTIEVGMGLVAIGRPDTAVRLLEEGMAERSADYARDTALGLAAIAEAQLDQHDVDGAIETARRAAETASGLDSSRVLDRLKAFGCHLPTRAPAAEEFRSYLGTV